MNISDRVKTSAAYQKAQAKLDEEKAEQAALEMEGILRERDRALQVVESLERKMEALVVGAK